MTRHYDLLVIGAGQSGDPLIRAAAANGKRAALVERKFIGGTCVNTGCTPTKTLLASADVAHLARHAAEFGVPASTGPVDFPAIIARKDKLVHSFRDGTRERLQSLQGVDLIFGQARFTHPKAVQVAGSDGTMHTLSADTIVINTGGRPAIPDLPGIEQISYLTSTTVMDLSALPDHLVILGGGAIAVEFAQMFRRFGSQVTVLQRASQILSQEDPDIAQCLADVLLAEGIRIVTRFQAARVEPSEDGIVLHGRSDHDDISVSGSHLLVATGRTPNTDDLGLDIAGVDTDPQGYIKTDSTLATSAPGIYAMGDVKGGPAYTHISYDDFRVLNKRLFRGEAATIDGRLVPYTLFTSPQLGRIGITETQARQKGLNIRVAVLPMTEVARALECGETAGMMKAVVDAQSGQILGAAILGIAGGEVMAVLEVAMMGKLPYTVIRDAIFAHPTVAESLNNLFMTLDR